MATDCPDSADNESDLLLGILDILDPELFLKSCEQVCEEPQVLLVGGGDPVPAAPPAPVGAPPVKLEALNELIHFDHIYTKPVEGVGHEESGAGEEIDEEEAAEATFTEVTEVIVGEEAVCVKDEPEEVVIPTCDDQSPVDDLFSGASPSAFSQLEKEAFLVDTYSDSGYERSPSPFSDMCSEGSWEDMFASELFPQLISV